MSENDRPRTNHRCGEKSCIEASFELDLLGIIEALLDVSLEHGSGKGGDEEARAEDFYRSAEKRPVLFPLLVGSRDQVLLRI